MKKLLFSGLAIILAVSLSAGAVFAGEPVPKPNLLVTKIVELVADGVNSTVSSMNNITNIGAVNATVTRVTDTLYCQTGGEWVEVGKVEDDENIPNVVEVGDALELDYLFEFELPEEARALKNVVEVEVEGSTKVFHAVWTMEFEIEEPEGEEPEGEPVGDTVPAVKSQWQSGKSHCWHFNYANGASGRLNCQIKDGNLTGVFNGKGLDPEEECYRLSYGGVELGTGTANKAGKIHIKADGENIDWGDGPDVANLSLEPC